MLAVTGVRPPERLLTYRGDLGGIVVRNRDEPTSGCYYCTTVRGRGDGADVMRYVREGLAL